MNKTDGSTVTVVSCTMVPITGVTCSLAFQNGPIPTFRVGMGLEMRLTCLGVHIFQKYKGRGSKYFKIYRPGGTKKGDPNLL